MSFAAARPTLGRHPTGLALVAILHALLAYVIVSGLGRTAIDRVIVTGTRLVEATPPPPPPTKELPLPRTALPPPPLLMPLPVEVIPSTSPSPVQASPEPQARLPDAQTLPAEPVPTARPAAPHATPAVIQSGDPSCRPSYPPAAQRAGATGVSKINFTIDASGRVVAADLVQSAGPTREHRLLDKAAESALAQCPITVGRNADGQPIGTQVEVDYAWRLD
jgi:protein TonB